MFDVTDCSVGQMRHSPTQHTHIFQSAIRLVLALAYFRKNIGHQVVYGQGGRDTLMVQTWSMGGLSSISSSTSSTCSSAAPACEHGRLQYISLASDL